MFLYFLLLLDHSWCSLVVRHTVQLCTDWEGNVNLCGSCSCKSAHDWPAFRGRDDSDPLTGRANYSTLILWNWNCFPHFKITRSRVLWCFSCLIVLLGFWSISLFPLCYSLYSSSHWDLRPMLAFIQFWSPVSPTQLGSHCRSFSFSSGLNVTSSSSWTTGR